MFNRLLSPLGVRISRIRSATPTGPAPARPVTSGPKLLQYEELLERLRGNPLDPALHLALAEEVASQGHRFLAYASQRTAMTLGASEGNVEERLSEFASQLPDLNEIGHLLHHRFTTLAEAVAQVSGSGRPSILDVGGGHGQLAAYLPDNPYCLVEPNVNGISGENMPFAAESFDWVVSCHVLEHIPPGERDKFIDELILRSRVGVILLNPFHVPGTHERERLEMIVEVTGSDWAKEHLECELPQVEDLERYAKERGYGVDVRPSGNKVSSLPIVLMEHFARKSRSSADLKKINRFLNSRYMHLADVDGQPNAYLVVLRRSAGAMA